MKKLFIFTVLISIFLLAPYSYAASGKKIVSKCASCHKLKGPAVKTIKAIKARKAPDLFYAGSKFKKDWLVSFIQNPTTIRPAGTVYVNHIKLEGDTDVVTGVTKCPSKLSAGDAASAADYLMTLKDAKMKTGTAKLGKFSKARARMLMTKQQACTACHELGKRGGGISCPTFKGAGSRLNPDWIYSFVKNPQYWDPKIWMASGEMDDASLQLIVNYLSTFK